MDEFGYVLAALTHGQFYDLRLDVLPDNAKEGDGDWEPEAPGAGPSGIEIEHAGALLARWRVRVSEYDGGKARSGGIDGELGQVVKHIQAELGKLHDLSFWKGGGPGLRVDIAPHGNHRGDGAQPIDDIGLANIACMDDQVRAAKRGEGLGPREAMCI